MISRQDVLRFMRTDGGPVGVRLVADRFSLRLRAAEKHLRGLWGNGLIVPLGRRPPGCLWHCARGERFEGLRFILTERGRARVRWWELGDERDAESLFGD